MKQTSVVRSWYVGPALFAAGLAFLVAVAMTGCVGQAVSTPAGVGSEEADAVTAIDTSYSDALDVSDHLVLGTMRLEGGDHAVTPEQAAALLPLWQAIQGGTLQGDSEVNAVLSQIEDQMTSEQLAAIAAMQLTQEDLQAWAQEQGVRMGVGGEPGQMGAGQNLSEEERAERMAELGITGGSNLSEMSEEDRAAIRATMEASGVMPAGDRVGVGSGQANMLLNPLIELLNQRAAE